MLTAICPAKINLSLRVLGRRDDGFHELDTVFQAIDLWDRLDLEAGADLRISCDDPAVPIDESNLVLRAAGLLRERFGDPSLGASFTLHKQIPAQGGLGGGSSNAAASLLLCARHWKLSPSAEQLTQLASELGSDVAFFLRGGTARGLGRGERLESLPAVGARPLILGFPPFGTDTREVYRRLAARLTLPLNGVNLAHAPAHKWPEHNDLGVLVNDLESVVFEGWPELESFRDALLERGATGALLSGSGSTVFGVFDEIADRDDARATLNRQFATWRVISSSSIDAGIRLIASGS